MATFAKIEKIVKVELRSDKYKKIFGDSKDIYCKYLYNKDISSITKLIVYNENNIIELDHSDYYENFKEIPIDNKVDWSTGEYDELYIEFFNCPNCKLIACVASSYNYCPHCGMKMDWGEG